MHGLRERRVHWRPRSRLHPVVLLLSGLPACLSSLGSASAQSTPLVLATPRDPFASYVSEASQRFGVPELWIRAVMRIESRGDVRAISTKGAMGLMQIMPATWAYLRVRNGLGDDPYNPRENILAGAAYLRELHDRYGAAGFLAAYNAGPGRYEEYRRSGRPLPAETIAYVAAIAPAIGVSPITPSVPAAMPDPLAWTRSALFIPRGGDTSTTTERQPDDISEALPMQTPEPPSASSDAQRDAIFVARVARPAPQ